MEWLGVTQGQFIDNVDIRWSTCDFLIDFHRNYTHIFYRFRVIASCRKSPILTYSACIWQLRWGCGIGFCRHFQHQRTRVPELSCDVVCVMIRLAVSIEHRLVTDGRTDRRTDTRRQLIPALASVARLKIGQHWAKLRQEHIL